MKKKALVLLLSASMAVGIAAYPMEGMRVNAADYLPEEPAASIADNQEDIPVKLAENTEDWDWNEEDDGSVSILEYFGSDTEVEVPSVLEGMEVTAIGQGAFQNNEGIVRVTIPDTVKTIGDNAFSWCRGLESISLPEGLENIENNAFSMCVGLQSISLPGSLKKIGEGAFSNCSGLEGIEIPAQVEKIENGTFSYCAAFHRITIPENLTSIGEGAFEWSGLKSIQLPKNVSKIGIRAFSTCDNLEKIEVDPGNSAFLSEDGILFDKKKTELLAYPEGKTQESYAVPSGVQKIGAYAFAYQNDNALSKVTLPESLQEIGPYAFYYAYFKQINFPDNLKEIGEFAFAYNAFQEVAIPANTEKIGAGAFVYAPELSAIKVDASNAYYASEDGLLLNKEKTVLFAYPGGKKDIEYVIPAGITEIAPYAFTTYSASPYPEKIIIPQYVERLKTDAFSGVHMRDIVIKNPKCEIDWAMDENGNKTGAILSYATIHGYENSTAQEYAQKNGNPFAVLSNEACQHDYTEKITTPATCKKKGSKTFTCKKCGDSYTAEIAMTAHNYQSVIKKATATKDGSIQKKCSRCGNITESRKIARIKTVALSKPSVTYTGKAQKVSVTVKDSAGKKISAKNYSLSYSSNKNVGEATVTIKFQGNYTGSMKKAFQILPKGTSISKVTAKKKGFLAKWKKQASQTSGYQIQYSTNSKFKGKDAKTVSIKKNGTTSKSISKLKAKKKYYVRVRTYKTVKIKGKNVTLCSGWSKAKAITTKR